MDLDEFSRQLESMRRAVHAARSGQWVPRRPPGDVGGDVRGARGHGGGAAGRRGGAAAAERPASGDAAGGRGGAAAVSGPVRLRARRLPGDRRLRCDPGGESGGRRAAGGLAALPDGQAGGQLRPAGGADGVPRGPQSPEAGRPARGMAGPHPAAAGAGVRRDDHGGGGPRLGRVADGDPVDDPRDRAGVRGVAGRGRPAG